MAERGDCEDRSEAGAGGCVASGKAPPEHAADPLPRRLRIGVLTFHRCINYGSYWQARCLVDGLRRAGHEVVLLDHSSPQIDWTEWRCAMQPLLPRRSPRADIRLYADKARAFRTAFERLPLSRPFPLDRPEAMEACDLVVVGSDEVWNLTHPWYGGQPLFYGSGIRAPRIVSYAASFGNYDAGAGLERSWADRLARFSAISVRDENSRRLVREALAAEPALVLDPCLQFPPSPPVADRERQESPYVVVYGHGFPEWLSTAARRWSEARGYRLVSIGYRNDWADEQAITAGPDEFVALIAGSAAVVTNFFHGCVFSLLNAKPFVSASTPYRMNKVRDLMASLGAEDHLLDHAGSEGDLAKVLDRPLRQAIGETIVKLRADSTRYLDAVLA